MLTWERPAPARQGDRGERPSFMGTNGLITDRLVGPALPSEYRVLGFDDLVRAGQRCDPEKLAKELATEHPVVFQLLVSAFELRRPTVIRRRLCDVQASEQIGPEIGHPPSVSQILGVENVILGPIRSSWR